ncbi:MAG TPA: cyclic-di-AMP receptor [Chloroflexota bacterium]
MMESGQGLPPGGAPLISKLVLVIVQDDDAETLIDAVINRGYRVTRINTVGGFLRKGNATLLIAIDERHLVGLLYLIRQHCRTRLIPMLAAPPFETGEPFLAEPLEVEVGGAVVFILDLDHFESF